MTAESASVPRFSVEGSSELPREGESVLLSLTNASSKPIYVLSVPYGAAWRVDGVNRITSDCAYTDCPTGPVVYCQFAGAVCGLSAVAAQELQPGDVFEFEWTNVFEILEYTCDEYAGHCEEAHAIAPGDYEVSVQYGLSHTNSPPFDTLENVTTLTTLLSFPKERRVEFIAN
jgi:hypothetical protein